MQLEPIIKIRFKKFAEQHELPAEEESKNFKIYVNFLLFTAHRTGVFSLKTDLFDTVSVGGISDLGLDSIGIKVNDTLITSKDDIFELAKAKKKVNIELFFTQSKYRPNFVVSEFLTLSSGVIDAVFEKRYKLANEKVKVRLDTIDYILSKNAMMLWDKKLSVRTYFVAMGKWCNDVNIIVYESKIRDDILAMGDYEDVKVHYVDTNALFEIIDNNENRFEVVISIGEQISFPEVEGVSNSILVYTDPDKLTKSLKTDDLIIRKSLFYDSVRVFQGDTMTNNEIFKTISTAPETFILLNNGITIICDHFSLASRKATIHDP